MDEKSILYVDAPHTHMCGIHICVCGIHIQFTLMVPVRKIRAFWFVVKANTRTHTRILSYLTHSEGASDNTFLCK